MYRGWTIVWALGVTTIVSYGTTQYLFGVLVLPMQHDLRLSRAAVTGAFSLTLLTSGLLGVPIGHLVDRHGARLLMAAGSALGGAGLLAASQVRNGWQLYAAWAGLIALSMALTLYPVTFTVVTNWFVRRRGSALALLTLLGGLASPIFIPAAGVLVDRIGWRAALAVMAAIQLGVALPLHAIVVRRRPEDAGLRPDGDDAAAPAPDGEDAGGLRLAGALATAPFWSLTAAFALGMLASQALLANQVAYLVGRGFDPVLAASAAGFVGVASLPGRYLLNRLSERLSPRALLAGCFAAQAGGVALLAAAAVPALVWAYVAVYGAAFGAVSPLRASTMADQFGRRAYGAITATSGVAAAVASAAGPVAAGALYDAAGSYGPALGLMGAAFALSALAVALTPRSRR